VSSNRHSRDDRIDHHIKKIPVVSFGGDVIIGETEIALLEEREGNWNLVAPVRVNLYG
jgi:hypothetical protein